MRTPGIRNLQMAAPGGVGQRAEAEPELFCHASETHQCRVLSSGTQHVQGQPQDTRTRCPVCQAQGHPTTEPSVDGGGCGGSRSVLRSPPDPHLTPLLSLWLLVTLLCSSVLWELGRWEAHVPPYPPTPRVLLSSRGCPDDRQDNHLQAVQGKSYSPHLEGTNDFFHGLCFRCPELWSLSHPCSSPSCEISDMTSFFNFHPLRSKVRVQQKQITASYSLPVLLY